MKICITGGTGFIGKHLVERLRRGGHEILELSHARAKEGGVQYIKGEMEKFRPDAVVHLAWEGIPDASEALAKKNVEMSIELIRITGEAKCKTFLGTGSCLEYGGLKGKVREEDAGTPPNPLYKAKAELYKKGKEQAERLGIKFIWARPFYVYGPGQKKESLIPQLITTFKKGEKLKLQNPDAANDFIYVKDASEALALLVEKNAPAGAYNIGSGKITSVREIARTVAEELNAPEPELPPQGTLFQTFFADIQKIKEATGWRPATKLEEGIQTMVSWY